MTLSLTAVVVSRWVLLTLDGGFTGFRDAAGRSPVLEKRRMFWRNIVRGVVLAQLISGVTVGIAAVLMVVAPGAESLPELIVQAGTAMLWVYATYALAVLGALAFYAVPHPDVSSLATVLILGPFTLMRPLVILGGLVASLWHGDWRTGLLSLCGCGLVLAVTPLLDRRWRGVHPSEAHLY